MTEAVDKLVVWSMCGLAGLLGRHRVLCMLCGEPGVRPSTSGLTKFAYAYNTVAVIQPIVGI